MPKDITEPPYKHNETLFTANSGPMHFHMRPCNERRKLKGLIEHGGGILDGRISPNCIRLAPEGFFIGDQETISTDFIIRSVLVNKPLNTFDFALKKPIKGGQKVSFDKEGDIDKSPAKSKKKKISKLWNKFTLVEDEAMLKYLETHKKNVEAGGYAIYKEMVHKKIITGHTVQSMNNRFRKSIIHQLDKYPSISEKFKEVLRSTYGKTSKDRSKNVISKGDSDTSQSIQDSDEDDNFGLPHISSTRTKTLERFGPNAKSNKPSLQQNKPSKVPNNSKRPIIDSEEDDAPSKRVTRTRLNKNHATDATPQILPEAVLEKSIDAEEDDAPSKRITRTSLNKSHATDVTSQDSPEAVHEKPINAEEDDAPSKRITRTSLNKNHAPDVTPQVTPKAVHGMPIDAKEDVAPSKRITRTSLNKTDVTPQVTPKAGHGMPIVAEEDVAPSKRITRTSLNKSHATEVTPQVTPEAVHEKPVDAEEDDAPSKRITRTSLNKTDVTLQVSSEAVHKNASPPLDSKLGSSKKAFLRSFGLQKTGAAKNRSDLSKTRLLLTKNEGPVLKTSPKTNTVDSPAQATVIESSKSLPKSVNKSSSTVEILSAKMKSPKKLTLVITNIEPNSPKRKELQALRVASLQSEVQNKPMLTRKSSTHDPKTNGIGETQVPSVKRGSAKDAKHNCDEDNAKEGNIPSRQAVGDRQSKMGLRSRNDTSDLKTSTDHDAPSASNSSHPKSSPPAKMSELAPRRSLRKNKMENTSSPNVLDLQSSTCNPNGIDACHLSDNISEPPRKSQRLDKEPSLNVVKLRDLKNEKRDFRITNKSSGDDSMNDEDITPSNSEHTYIESSRKSRSGSATKINSKSPARKPEEFASKIRTRQTNTVPNMVQKIDLVKVKKEDDDSESVRNSKVASKESFQRENATSQYSSTDKSENDDFDSNSSKEESEHSHSKILRHSTRKLASVSKRNVINSSNRSQSTNRRNLRNSSKRSQSTNRRNLRNSSKRSQSTDRRNLRNSSKRSQSTNRRNLRNSLNRSQSTNRKSSRSSSQTPKELASKMGPKQTNVVPSMAQKIDLENIKKEESSSSNGDRDSSRKSKVASRKNVRRTKAAGQDSATDYSENDDFYSSSSEEDSESAQSESSRNRSSSIRKSTRNTLRNSGSFIRRSSRRSNGLAAKVRKSPSNAASNAALENVKQIENSSSDDDHDGVRKTTSKKDLQRTKRTGHDSRTGTSKNSDVNSSSSVEVSEHVHTRSSNNSERNSPFAFRRRIRDSQTMSVSSIRRSSRRQSNVVTNMEEEADSESDEQDESSSSDNNRNSAGKTKEASKRKRSLPRAKKIDQDSTTDTSKNDDFNSGSSDEDYVTSVKLLRSGSHVRRSLRRQTKVARDMAEETDSETDQQDESSSNSSEDNHDSVRKSKEAPKRKRHLLRAKTSRQDSANDTSKKGDFNSGSSSDENQAATKKSNNARRRSSRSGHFSPSSDSDDAKLHSPSKSAGRVTRDKSRIVQKSERATHRTQAVNSNRHQRRSSRLVTCRASDNEGDGDDSSSGKEELLATPLKSDRTLRHGQRQFGNTSVDDTTLILEVVPKSENEGMDLDKASTGDSSNGEEKQNNSTKKYKRIMEKSPKSSNYKINDCSPKHEASPNRKNNSPESSRKIYPLRRMGKELGNSEEKSKSSPSPNKLRSATDGKPEREPGTREERYLSDASTILNQSPATRSKYIRQADGESRQNSPRAANNVGVIEVSEHRKDDKTHQAPLSEERVQSKCFNKNDALKSVRKRLVMDSVKNGLKNPSPRRPIVSSSSSSEHHDDSEPTENISLVGPTEQETRPAKEILLMCASEKELKQIRSPGYKPPYMCSLGQIGERVASVTGNTNFVIRSASKESDACSVTCSGLLGLPCGIFQRALESAINSSETDCKPSFNDSLLIIQWLSELLHLPTSHLLSILRSSGKDGAEFTQPDLHESSG